MDVQFGIEDVLVLSEEKKSPQQQEIYRKRINKNFDKRFRSIPKIKVGDFVIVRNGIHGNSISKYIRRSENEQILLKLLCNFQECVNRIHFVEFRCISGHCEIHENTATDGAATSVHSLLSRVDICYSRDDVTLPINLRARSSTK